MGNLCNAEKRRDSRLPKERVRDRVPLPIGEEGHSESASREGSQVVERMQEEVSDSIANFTLQIPNNQMGRLRRENLNLTSKLDDVGTLSVSLLQLRQYAQDDDELLKLLRDFGLCALDPKTKIQIAFKPIEEDGGASQYVRAQLRRIAHPPEPEDGASLRILDTLFHLERAVPDEHAEFLAASSEIDARAYHCRVWDPDIHEIVYSTEQLAGVLGEAAALQQLQSCAQTANCPYASTLSQGNCILFDADRRNLADFDVRAFDSSNLLAAVLSLVNYDAMHSTSIIRRLLYPHVNAIPTRNDIGLHLVKLHLNGCKRAFPVQTDFQRSFTRQTEHFPALLARALGNIYPRIDSAPIAELLYRCIGWIPEKLLLSEAGDVQNSFHRLRESFNDGNFLLFVNDRTSAKVRPILDMQAGADGRQMIVTTASSGIKLIPWTDLLSICNTDYIHINWNPTIYDYRKQAHFRAIINAPIASDSDFECFNTHYATQLLLSLQPHVRETEVRLIIEKHHRPRAAPYRISYTLATYEENRVSLIKSNLRTVSVCEPTDELLADLIIFEKCETVQHFLLIVNLEPIGSPPPRGHSERVSATLFSFVDFELIEVPFRAVVQSAPAELFFRPETPRFDSRASISSFSSPFLASFPCFRLQVLASGVFELRAVGLPENFYTLQLFKAQGFAPSLAGSYALRQTEAVKRANVLTAKLEPNGYFLRVIAQTVPGPPSETAHSPLPHRIKIQILAFGKQLLRAWDASPPPAPVEAFVIEAFDLSQSVLNHKQRLEGAWTPQTNFGVTRATVPTYQRFYKNPGLIFTVSEETELACQLNCTWPRGQSASFSLCAFEILGDYSFKPIIEDTEYAEVEEILTETVVVRPNANGFMVLALNASTVSAKFVLELITNKPLSHVRDNRVLAPNFPQIEKFFFSTTPGSGGPPHAPCFLLNTAVVVRFMSDGDLFAVLRFEGGTEPVGLHLLAASKSALVELTDDELAVAKSTLIALPETQSLFARVQRGAYFLVPSTETPLARAFNYELALHSTAEMRLARLSPFTTSPALVRTLHRCSSGALRLRVRDRTRLLVDIASDRRTVKLDVQLQSESSAKTLSNFSGNEHHFRTLVDLSTSGELTLCFRDQWDMNSNFQVTLLSAAPGAVILH